MKYGPGRALGSVMQSTTKGIFPWDQADWAGAGAMADMAMEGMAGVAAIVIVLFIVAVVFLVSVFVRRAWRKDTTVARILWWAGGIVVACIALGWLLVNSGNESGWYLGAWAFLGLCLTATACELYSMRDDSMEITAEDLDRYLGSFSAA